MRTNSRKRVVTWAMAVLASVGGAARGAEGEGLTVVLHVTDLARTEGTKLGRAKVEAARIFENIGVRLVWADGAEGPAAHACEGHNLSLSLLSPILVRDLIRRGVGEKALGWANPSGGYAFIYSDRVDDKALQAALFDGVLLGRVIAHEVGHLLLDRLDHPFLGIMTAGISPDSTGAQTLFHESDARVIRARLESRARAADRRECGQRSAADR